MHYRSLIKKFVDGAWDQEYFRDDRNSSVTNIFIFTVCSRDCNQFCVLTVEFFLISPFNPFSYLVMTSQFVLCKISFNHYTSVTRGDTKKQLTAIFLIFSTFSLEKKFFFVSYTL